MDRLIQELDSIQGLQIVLVPNGLVKQWLLLEIAKRKGIAMGLKVVTPEQLFPSSSSPLNTFCSLYTALAQEGELSSYLSGKKKRLFALTRQMSVLFAKYEKYPPDGKGWQQELFQTIFKPQIEGRSEPIICFGIDDLPPKHWQSLFQAPALSIYSFSPCIDFWEDLCSDRERKKLTRYWEKRGAAQNKRKELDAYLREGPRLLANWGKLGRMTLKELGAVDLDGEELYAPLEPTSLLKQIQCDLLTFQETKEPNVDDSIHILQTGSSRLVEVEALKEAILRLECPYHEISVLAPDIEPYAPLIEYVFGEEVPHRISGFSKASPFKEGLKRLLGLGSSRWSAEDILSLFESPAFYRKQRWDEETLETFRGWIEKVRIEWGLDADHRNSVLQETLGKKEFAHAHSWEKGLDALLDAIVYLKPMQINPDLFEELLRVLFALKNLDLKGEKSLPEWAHIIQKGAEEFLHIDPEETFQSVLLEMRRYPGEELFPLEVASHFLLLPTRGQIHGSQLHAVSFAPLQEAASLPAKALFLIGMDEMSFPRTETPSSLDLLKGKTPSLGDLDRYAFLRALFAAKERLHISYGHLSAEEGKAVSPSLLVQELLAITGPEIMSTYRAKKDAVAKKGLSFPSLHNGALPEGDITIPISELKKLARHPWKFYLQKAHSIFLHEELEESFALQQGTLLRGGSICLPGPFQNAMESEALEKVNERTEQMQEWQIEPFSLHLRENCTTAGWEGADFVAAPLELHWDKLHVKIVGEIKLVSSKGIISPNEDGIEGSLKIWPEALVTACVLDAPQIWMLRSGKTKPLKNPKAALQAFLEYYFHCLEAPSPLLPTWADAFLRKKDFSMDRDVRLKDPVMDWVFARAEIPSAEPWAPLLRNTFQELIDLYPTRGAHAKV